MKDGGVNSLENNSSVNICFMRVKKQYHVQYTGCKPWFRLSEINFNVQPDDIIELEYDPEGYSSENESWEPYSKVTIYREEEETEQERNLRLEQVRLESERLKQRRYESYLKLKQEFEVNDSSRPYQNSYNSV